MHLVFDIFQGLGIAVAVGIRPFLPALCVGALAAGDVQIDFKGTDLSFVQHAPFLLGMVIGALGFAVIDRQLRGNPAAQRPVALLLAAFGLAIAALLFAGALAQDHYTEWAGAIGGAACAALGAAARPRAAS